MKQKQIFPFLLSVFLILIVFHNSCTKDQGKLPSLPITNPMLCDSLNIKFSTDIIAITQANCVVCHPGMGAPGNFNLYTNVQTVALNGKLWNRVNTLGSMPPTGKLPDSLLQKIDCWIKAGALNN